MARKIRIEYVAPLLGDAEWFADCQSAIQPTASRRYAYIPVGRFRVLRLQPKIVTYKESLIALNIGVTS